MGIFTRMSGLQLVAEPQSPVVSPVDLLVRLLAARQSCRSASRLHRRRGDGIRRPKVLLLAPYPSAGASPGTHLIVRVPAMTAETRRAVAH